MAVHVRYFAGAKAAVGRASDAFDHADASTIGALIATVAARHDDSSAVLARCSFLVDGVSTRDSATPLVDGSRVDVLPPFAGG